MSTFLFYDLETTGLDPVFDQILQFAAIRTDEALHPIGAPVNWFVRLRPDVIPAPAALMTSNRAVGSLQNGRTEYEVIVDIHRLVNEPGTVSIGHNSLGFDDKFLRFGFYRNLLPAYTHQYVKGCGRADLLAILIRYRHFAPDALVWPELAGSPTLKLEHLAAANGCEDGPAHDALADVQASINIARLLRPHDDVWRDAINSFGKQRDQALADNLPEWRVGQTVFRKGALLSAKCGKEALYASPALLIGPSKTCANQTYWLKLDDDGLFDSLSNKPADQVWWRKKWTDVPQVIQPGRIRFRDEQVAAARANLAWMGESEAYLSWLREYARQYIYPAVDNIDNDAAIYERGFPKPSEADLRLRFHAAPLAEKPALAAKMTHPVDRALAYRLLWRNYGLCAGDMECLRPLLDETGCKDYKNGWKRTRAEALAELEDLESGLSPDDEKCWQLQDMRQWLRQEDRSL